MNQLNSQPEAQRDEHAALAGHNVSSKMLWQAPTRPHSDK